MLRRISAIALLAAVGGQQDMTALSGDITLSGTVADKGAVCVRFRLASGETISLQGASPQEYTKGARFRLTGIWLRVSNCMQGRAFRVSSRAKI